MTHVHFFISYTVTLTWAVRMCAYIVSLFSIVLCCCKKNLTRNLSPVTRNGTFFTRNLFFLNFYEIIMMEMIEHYTVSSFIYNESSYIGLEVWSSSQVFFLHWPQILLISSDLPGLYIHCRSWSPDAGDGVPEQWECQLASEPARGLGVRLCPLHWQEWN